MNPDKLPEIVPVILSGGAGTRLWPLSQPARPKQFLVFTSRFSLFVDTLMRCRGAIFDKTPIIVGSGSHRHHIAAALQDTETPADVLLEPMGRDSCAAIVAAALHAVERNPDTLILVMAADHHIPDHAGFANAAASALSAAQSGKLVTFGVRPSFPATGYGYIKPGAALTGTNVLQLDKFVEKPDASTAQRYIADGYFWNSGNFLFKAAAFIAEATRFAPDIVRQVRLSLQNADRNDGFMLLEAEAFAAAPKISVDFAIMEKTADAAVLPVDYLWSDIGSWDTVAATAERDQNGNARIGQGLILNSTNSFVHSEGLPTVVIGVDDICVVTTADAVLVVRKGQTELVKSAVETLTRNPQQAK